MSDLGQQCHHDGYLDRRSAVERYLLGHELAVIDAALTNIRGSGWLLDGCCGSGQLGSAITGGRLRRLGLDSDPLALRRFHDRDAGTLLVQADIVRQPIAGGALDCVVAIHAFDHLDRLGFLAECRRVLRPGGLVIFDFLNRHSYKQAWKRYIAGARHDRDPAFRQKWLDGFSYHEVLQALVRTGFSLQAACGYGWLPFANDSDSPLVPGAARAEDLLGLHQLCPLSPRVLVVARKQPA